MDLEVDVGVHGGAGGVPSHDVKLGEHLLVSALLLPEVLRVKGGDPVDRLVLDLEGGADLNLAVSRLESEEAPHHAVGLLGRGELRFHARVVVGDVDEHQGVQLVPFHGGLARPSTARTALRTAPRRKQQRAEPWARSVVLKPVHYNMGERGQTCSLEKGAGAAATAGTTRRAETRPTHDTSASFASLVRTRRTDRSRSSSRPDVHSQARCLDPPRLPP